MGAQQNNSKTLQIRAFFIEKSSLKQGRVLGWNTMLTVTFYSPANDTLSR
jgi:hypothetical protein